MNMVSYDTVYSDAAYLVMAVTISYAVLLDFQVKVSGVIQIKCI
jgi:hypothetical protein